MDREQLINTAKQVRNWAIRGSGIGLIALAGCRVGAAPKTPTIPETKPITISYSPPVLTALALVPEAAPTPTPIIQETKIESKPVQLTSTPVPISTFEPTAYKIPSPLINKPELKCIQKKPIQIQNQKPVSSAQNAAVFNNYFDLLCSTQGDRDSIGGRLMLGDWQDPNDFRHHIIKWISEKRLGELSQTNTGAYYAVVIGEIEIQSNQFIHTSSDVENDYQIGPYSYSYRAVVGARNDTQPFFEIPNTINFFNSSPGTEDRLNYNLIWDTQGLIWNPKKVKDQHDTLGITFPFSVIQRFHQTLVGYNLGNNTLIKDCPPPKGCPVPKLEPPTPAPRPTETPISIPTPDRILANEPMARVRTLMAWLNDIRRSQSTRPTKVTENNQPGTLKMTMTRLEPNNWQGINTDDIIQGRLNRENILVAVNWYREKPGECARLGDPGVIWIAVTGQSEVADITLSTTKINPISNADARNGISWNSIVRMDFVTRFRQTSWLDRVRGTVNSCEGDFLGLSPRPVDSNAKWSDWQPDSKEYNMVLRNNSWIPYPNWETDSLDRGTQSLIVPITHIDTLLNDAWNKGHQGRSSYLSIR